MSETILKVEGLRAGYGPIEVLKGIDLEVHRGEMVTIIGANGAGKTSTLLTIAGIIRATAGSVVFEGQELTKLPAHKIVKRRMALIPEGRKIFPKLSVIENLEMGAYVRRDRAEIAIDMDRVCDLFPILRDRRRQAGGTLSGGEQQMLAMGRALMSRPELLLMDEPSMGIAPLLTQRIFEAVQALNKEGMSILLVEQNASLALGMASRGYVLEVGEIVMNDQANVLLKDPRVQAAYWGDLIPFSGEGRLIFGTAVFRFRSKSALGISAGTV